MTKLSKKSKITFTQVTTINNAAVTFDPDDHSAAIGEQPIGNLVPTESLLYKGKYYPKGSWTITMEFTPDEQ